ncbi:MAG: YecA family protein [Sedimenticola sp.]|nr:YecA family protein [Sedimenticola sp.]
MSESSLSYERVERQMASADIESSGAEVHGILCGLICAGRQDALERWFGELFEQDQASDLLVRECADSLRKLHDETLSAVRAPGLGVSPFLPEEEKGLKLRASAVCDWCQGFLYGLGVAGIPPAHSFSSETREALNALSEITRMDLEGLQGSEEDEASLMELTEFIWVAAMLVHSELVADKTEHS